MASRGEGPPNPDSLPEERPSLSGFPLVLLHRILASVLPTPPLLAETEAWRCVLRLAAAASLLHDALGDLLRTAPALAGLEPRPDRGRTCWFHAVRHLAPAAASASPCPGCGPGWRRLAPVQAVRPSAQAWAPLSEPPRLSGASLCALGPGLLVAHGGRCSTSGDTLGSTYLARIVGARAVWDRLCPADAPAARCYHAAAAVSLGPGGAEGMLVFGGNGSDDSLFDDLWRLQLRGDRSRQPVGQWRQMPRGDRGPSPEPRSSHVFAAWRRERAVLHGGLGHGGTLADTWLVSPEGCWQRLPTAGAAVARAHHCGAVCGDRLLLFWGQDEGYLTVSSTHALDLREGTWQEVSCRGPAARIDAAAAAVEDVGVLVLGGVNRAFEFDDEGAWLMRAFGGVARPQAVGVASNSGPKPHACGALCAQGLQLYNFGGFDGHQDLNELHVMSLAPSCFSLRG